MSKELSIREESFLSRLENVLATQNQAVLGKVGEVSKKVDMFDQRIISVEKDINFMKNERPIERREAGKIRRKVSERVCELLEVPFKKKDRTLEEQVRYEKYSRQLFGRCYAEIPYEGHMAKGSYLDTPKREFDSTMKDIEVFRPVGGMQNFYEEADKKALAKKIAKEQGYI